MAAEPLAGKKVLITGAAGFTGLHACDYFVRQGALVIAAGRSGKPLENIPNVVSAACRLEDREQTEALIRDSLPDYVLHLAGKNSTSESWHHPEAYMESNFMAAVYLFEALRRHRPDCVVLIVGSRLSIDAAQGPAAAPHPYSLSKTFGTWAAAAWHNMYRQPILIAEPSNLIGPGESKGFCTLLARYIAQCEAGREQPQFQISFRHESRDFLDVRDAVRAYALLLTRGTPGVTYPVGSGAQHTLEQLANALLGLSRHPIPIDWGPETSDLSPDSSSKGSGDPQGDGLLKALGWKPCYPLSRSVADIMAYARSQTAVP